MTITKVTNPANSGTDTFAYTTTGAGLSGFTLDTNGADATNSNTKVFTIAPADLGAKTVDEGTTAGWTLTGLTCSEGTTNLATGVASFTVDAGDAITCTYTNTHEGHGDPSRRSPTRPTGHRHLRLHDDRRRPLGLHARHQRRRRDQLQHQGLHHRPRGPRRQDRRRGHHGRLDPDRPDLSEGTTNLATGVASFTVDAGDAITCTYTNTHEATVTITKVTDPANSGTDTFAYTTTGAGLSGFTLDTNGADATNSNTKVFTIAPADLGAQTVDEGTTAGWTLTGLTCSEGTTNLATGVASLPSMPVSDHLHLHEHPRGPVTITKVTNPANSGTDTFAYTTTGAGLSGFTLDTNGADATNSNTKVFTIAPADPAPRPSTRAPRPVGP